MRLSIFLLRASLILLCPAVPITIGLYLYPALLGCSFPGPLDNKVYGGLTTNGVNSSHIEHDHAVKAPFRLLAFGDPQLEGDSSLPSQDSLSFPSLQRLRHALQAKDKARFLVDIIVELYARDFPTWLRYYRKRLDLLGNDYYLAHIYRTLHWWTEPTHVAVLGDLIGSQWISDDEFQRRSWRYWNRVFRHGIKVDDFVMESHGTEQLGQDQAWSRRVINIAGNHDIGYAGDINRRRIERFEREYGRVNWDVGFDLPLSDTLPRSHNDSSTYTPPSLRVVILNNMNLDGPALDSSAQAETYQYINDLVSSRLRPVEDKTFAIILLTHIPLEKQIGVCVDNPYFSYHENGLKEQNHLSSQASKNVLEGIFGKSNRFGAIAKGLGRNGIILAGHDHEGCDVYHHTDPPPTESEVEPSIHSHTSSTHKWNSTLWQKSNDLITSAEIPGVREITLRSMMGSYGGYAGLLSAWFDDEMKEWRFEHSYCPLGIQHIWWAVHIIDIIVASLLLSTLLSLIIEKTVSRRQGSGKLGYRQVSSSSNVVLSNVGNKTLITTGSQPARSPSKSAFRRKRLYREQQ